MPSRQHSTKSDLPTINRTRSLIIQGETELWLNAWESAFLKPPAHMISKTRNTLLRA